MIGGQTPTSIHPPHKLSSTEYLPQNDIPNNTKHISELSIPSQVYSPTKNCKCQEYQEIIEKKNQQILDLKKKVTHYQALSLNTGSSTPRPGTVNVLQSLEENNSFLKEIVGIEEKKNLLSNKFIAEILRLLDIPSSEIKLVRGQLQLSPNNPFRAHQFSQPPPQLTQSPGANSFGDQSPISPRHSDQLQKVSKERDELYQLSEDLYHQIKAEKEFKAQLASQLKEKENNQHQYE